MHIQSLAYSKLHKGKYYEQTKINGIEVIYVVDWLLPINLKTVKIFTALLDDRHKRGCLRHPRNIAIFRNSTP